MTNDPGKHNMLAGLAHGALAAVALLDQELMIAVPELVLAGVYLRVALSK